MEGKIKDNKTLLMLGVLILLLIIGLFYSLRKKGSLKKETKVMQAEEEVNIPTISDDTSLEAIEKEIDYLNVDEIDKVDLEIESDLQNL